MSVTSSIPEKYEMIKAIHEQPSALTRVYQKEISNIKDVAKAVRSAKSFHIVGIGTSFHAARIGEHFFRQVAGQKSVAAWNSCDFVNSGISLSAEDCVIVLSHRGSKKFSAASLLFAKNNNAISVLVTGLETHGDPPTGTLIIYTSRQETSSAFTISHTAAIFVLQLLALELRKDKPQNYSQITEQLPQYIENVITLTEVAAKRLAKSLAPQFIPGKDSHLYLVGWGVGTWTAFEIALKLKETSYILCEGFQLEQYLHGPFCATTSATVVVFVAPRGYGIQRTIEVLRLVKGIGAKAIVVCDDSERRFDGEVTEDERILVPVLSEEEDSPHTAISFLVPLQLFTYYLAIELGTNPDVFRRDNKLYADSLLRLQL